MKAQYITDMLNDKGQAIASGEHRYCYYGSRKESIKMSIKSIDKSDKV